MTDPDAPPSPEPPFPEYGPGTLPDEVPPNTLPADPGDQRPYDAARLSAI